MRLTKEQTAKNRKKIVETAARVFRERGIEGVSVIDLMKEAGFTHGGFYNHFASKDELLAEAGRAAFRDTIGGLTKLASSGTNGRQFVESLYRYLSPSHRANFAGGCPAAGFAGEVSRQGREMQHAYAEGIRAVLKSYESLVSRKANAGKKASNHEQAIELLANLVGSLMLARAVAKADPELSDEFLAAGRRRLPK
jgi:TetR/AcrR family transcriptional regulator, transcriptional repressor for nem operon